MNLFELFFIIQFIFVIGIIIVKLFNLFSVGKFYDLKVAFILFIMFFFCWLVGMGVNMIDSEGWNAVLYSMLMRIEHLFFIIVFLITFIEVFLFISNLRSGGDSYYSSGRRD